MSLRINGINLNHNPAEKMNEQSVSLAKKLYTLPAEVPQFKDGGLVNRLADSHSRAATQTADLRYRVQNPPGKTYIQPQPQPMRTVDVGPQSDYRFPGPGAKLGPSVVDSQMVGNTAHSLANAYTGPYQDKVRAMFPEQTGASRPGSLAQRVLGYKDGGKVVPEHGMIEGPGTGKSDDINATLEENDYILPIEVVEHFGEEFLNRLVMAAMQSDMQEEGQTVPAKVSNGEFRVPNEAVEFYGADFWDNIKNMSGNVNETDNMEYNKGGEVNGYESGGLVKDYEELRKQGYGAIPAGAKSYVENVVNPTRGAIGNVKDAVVDKISNVGNNLFSTPEAPSLANKPQVNQDAQRNFQVSNQATQKRLASESQGGSLRLNQPNKELDPNIYGPGGVNFGPNPSLAQRQQLIGNIQDEQTLDPIKLYQQKLDADYAQQNRLDADRANQLHNYGQTFDQFHAYGQPDYGLPLEQQRLGLEGKRGDLEQQKFDFTKGLASRPQGTKYGAVRNPDANNEVTTYPEEGALADQYYKEQQVTNRRKQNALSILNDPNMGDQEKNVAKQFLNSIGFQYG